MVQVFKASSKIYLEMGKNWGVDKSFTLFDILHNGTIFVVEKMIFCQISLDH